MNLIDLRPVRRCGDCGHLVPADRKTCPYCNGESTSPVGVQPAFREEQPTAPAAPREPMSPATKKKLLIGGCVVAVAIVALVVFNVVRGMYRLDKSILEPLSESDVTALVDDDPEFAKFYSVCTDIREAIKTPEDKAKYGKITYKQFKEFMNYYDNPVWHKEQFDEFQKDYDRDYATPMNSKVDALVNKWKKFVEDCDLSKYITITPTTRYAETYGGDYHPCFWFNTKMPKGKLTNCEVRVRSVDNSDYEDYRINAITFSLDELLSCTEDSYKYFPGIYDGTYWDDYHLDIQVLSVTLADGKTLTEESVNEVPETVKAYIDTESDEARTAMIHELIDKSYPTLQEYQMKRLNEKLQEKSPVCYELITKVGAATGKLPAMSSY